MNRCYITGAEITEENKSVEHIIQNFLGGKLKSSSILCEEGNNSLGDTIDAELSRQIYLPTLLKIKRENGKPRKIRGFNKEGRQYNYVDTGIAKRAPSKPIISQDENGKEVWEFQESQEKDVIKAIMKRNPGMSEEELKKRLTYTQLNKPEEIFFENHLNVISGKDAFRAIAKIGVNFYCCNGGDYGQINQSIDFVKGNVDDEFPCVRYYYPEEVYSRTNEKEISHVLRLVADPVEGVAYCYIELFNAHNFLVTLSLNYSGEALDATYVFDVTSTEVLDNTTRDLDLTKRDLMLLPHPAPSDVEQKYFERQDRLAQLMGIEITRKSADEVMKFLPNSGKGKL